MYSNNNRPALILVVIALVSLISFPGWAQDGEAEMWCPCEAREDGPQVDMPPFDPTQDPSQQRLEQANPTMIGGYGELEYTDVEGPGGRSFDFHRMVLFIGHQFTEDISFYSEIEYEHSNVLEMEQAYIEYDIADSISMRAGLVLVPVGLTNIYHEPSLYHGAVRPLTDKYIIPTTWREACAGLIYTLSDYLTIEAYALSPLNAANFGASSGIRGGRQHVSKALGNDIAFAMRASSQPILGLNLGLSGYMGWADNGQFGADVQVSIAEFDATYRNHGIEARAQVASVHISETEVLSEALDETIGSQGLGWYVEGAYNILDFMNTQQAILPFVRYEQFNTHASVEGELEADPNLDRTDMVFGMTYRPIPQVSFKFDYTLSDSAGDDTPDKWDLGIGWMF
jgi:hypothetical protein